ncbi:MAG: hypothetical protein A07HB70_01782 [uncultured archaeon A07HB70]|nr:MAG: hypothetical protein A07HB70_01782 [uncultured archaeon A07HB70]
MAVFNRFGVVALVGDDRSERFDHPVAVFGMKVVGNLLADQSVLVVPIEALDRWTFVQYYTLWVQKRQQISRV